MLINDQSTIQNIDTVQWNLYAKCWYRLMSVFPRNICLEMAENCPLISAKHVIAHAVPKADQIWTTYYGRCQNKVIEAMKFQRSGDSGKRPFWRNKGPTYSLQNEKRNKWAKEKEDMCIWKLEKNRIDKEEIRWKEKRCVQKKQTPKGFRCGKT